MTQRIDQEKLREAAEHLEWVLSRYHEDETMRQVWEGLAPLIERAKRGEITEIIKSGRIPFHHAFLEGEFHRYISPNFPDAYLQFCIEAEGGLTEEDKATIKKLRDIVAEKVKGHGQ